LFYFTGYIAQGRPDSPCYQSILDLSKNYMLVFGVLTSIHFALLILSRIFFDDLFIKVAKHQSKY